MRQPWNRLGFKNCIQGSREHTLSVESMLRTLGDPRWVYSIKAGAWIWLPFCSIGLEVGFSEGFFSCCFLFICLFLELQTDPRAYCMLITHSTIELCLFGSKLIATRFISHMKSSVREILACPWSLPHYWEQARNRNTQVPIDCWRKKENVLHTQGGIQFNREKIEVRLGWWWRTRDHSVKWKEPGLGSKCCMPHLCGISELTLRKLKEG